TLATVPSLLVGVGGHTFAIPLASVIEAVNDAPEERAFIQGRPVLRWRDRVLPLIDLSARFELALPPAAAPSAHTDSERRRGGGRKIVVVGLLERQVAFLVDALAGQEEVVIKTLGEYLGRVAGIAGGTILGDGSVALILDIGALVGQAH